MILTPAVVLPLVEGSSPPDDPDVLAQQQRREVGAAPVPPLLGEQRVVADDRVVEPVLGRLAIGIRRPASGTKTTGKDRTLRESMPRPAGRRLQAY